MHFHPLGRATTCTENPLESRRWATSYCFTIKNTREILHMVNVVEPETVDLQLVLEGWQGGLELNHQNVKDVNFCHKIAGDLFAWQEFFPMALSLSVGVMLNADVHFPNWAPAKFSLAATVCTKFVWMSPHGVPWAFQHILSCTAMEMWPTIFSMAPSLHVVQEGLTSTETVSTACWAPQTYMSSMKGRRTSRGLKWVRPRCPNRPHWRSQGKVAFEGGGSRCLAFLACRSMLWKVAQTSLDCSVALGQPSVSVYALLYHKSTIGNWSTFSVRLLLLKRLVDGFGIGRVDWCLCKASALWQKKGTC